MKCLIINGSASKSYLWNGAVIEGFTGRLTEEVKNEMRRLGEVEFEEIRLSDVNLPYCRGCHTCFTRGEKYCPHNKLVSPLVEKIREADCMILTSPVYALNVSALVKGLFDLTAYNYHRPSFFDKKALVISSTAGGMAWRVCAYMRDTLKHWGFNRVYTLAVIRMGAPEPNEKTKEKCRAAARRFYADAASGRLHAPSLKRVFYYQLWRNLSLGSRESPDYAYWQESGLVNHEFSPQVKTGPAKKAFGKMINGLLRSMMKIKP
jgi:multimeric flavodoxin WrbA